MREQREKLCDLCYACKHDCVHNIYDSIERCVNYEKGLTRKEYVKIVSEEGINLKKLCNKNNLNLNVMYKMLSGKIHLKFKYRYALDSRIFESYDQKYIERFNGDNNGE